MRTIASSVLSDYSERTMTPDRSYFCATHTTPYYHNSRGAIILRRLSGDDDFTTYDRPSDSGGLHGRGCGGLYAAGQPREEMLIGAEPPVDFRLALKSSRPLPVRIAASFTARRRYFIKLDTRAKMRSISTTRRLCFASIKQISFAFGRRYRIEFASCLCHILLSTTRNRRHRAHDVDS